MKRTHQPAGQRDAVSLARQHFMRGEYARVDQVLKAIGQKSPAYRDAQCVRAAALQRTGKSAQAQKMLLELHRTHAPSAESYSLLGLTYRTLGDLPSAEDCLSKAVEVDETFADAWHNLSVVRTDRAQHKAALEAAERTLSLRPDSLDVLKQAGRCALHMRNADLTERYYSRVLEKDATVAEAYNGLGGVEIIRNRPSKAIEHFDKALAIDANLASAVANRALAYKNSGDFERAEEGLRRAQELDPKNPEHRWNLALTQLARGHLAEGFANYEVRYDPRRMASDRVVPPVTDVKMLQPNESAKGLHVALLPEQGLGDLIQFVALAKKLKAEGAKIVVVCPTALVPVVATVPWIDQVTPSLKIPVKLDRWLFVTSLAHRYVKSEVDIAATTPYMFPLASKCEQWAARFPEPKQHLRVGLVWAGRPTHSNDSNRSVKLEDFAHLATISGVRLYSLQKGEREQDLENAPFAIEALGPEIQDFSDTAAILEHLDLLVTIDSSPAHMAGAMAKPCIVLIPKIFDFRWLEGRTESPWYPGMQLLRQREIGDWASVHEALHQRVQAMAANHRTEAPTDPKLSPAPLLEAPPAGHGLLDAGVAWQVRRAVDFQQQGSPERAEVLYRWALQHEPTNLDSWRNLGVMYRRAKRFEDAYRAYDEALRIAPNDKTSLTNYANLLVDTENEPKALEVLEKSLGIDPHQPNAWYLYAVALENQGRSESALSAVDRALSLSPGRQDCQALRAITLTRLGRHEEAYPTLVAAVEREPNRADLMLTLAQHHQAQGDVPQADACYRKALSLAGRNKTMAYMNWGGLYLQTGQFDKALELTLASLESDPKNHDAWFNMALIRLVQGNFEEGWKLYEHRMHPERRARDRIRSPKLSKPYWNGEALAGKTLLIFPEQGYGDTIQFIRYAKHLKAMGTTVWCAVRPPLMQLLQEVDGIDRWITDGEAVQGYDYWVMPLSLPGRLGTTLATVPCEVPYVQVPEATQQRWSKQIPLPGNRPRVGLVWSGSPSHGNDKRRSIPLQLLLPLLELQAVEWVSLNYRVSESERDLLEARGVQEWGTRCQDFSDLAAHIQALDLLITVDSAPAHLGGAMGKRVWTLLPFSPDFRWMLGREDSPWYPAMRLKREPAPHAWPQLVSSLVGELAEWASRHTRRKPSVRVIAWSSPLHANHPAWALLQHLRAPLGARGIRLRLAEECQSPATVGNEALLEEWTQVEAKFQSVWQRGRPVQLDGAVGVVEINEAGRPAHPLRVQTQVTWAYVGHNAMGPDADMLERLKTYEVVLCASAQWADSCRAAGMAVIQLPDHAGFSLDSGKLSLLVDDVDRLLVGVKA